MFKHETFCEESSKKVSRLVFLYEMPKKRGRVLNSLLSFHNKKRSRSLDTYVGSLVTQHNIYCVDNYVRVDIITPSERECVPLSI